MILDILLKHRKRRSIDNSGNVGIGSTTPAAMVDVNGAVKVGKQTTCGASIAGAIRWTGSRIQGCNATTWVSLSKSAMTICGVTTSTYTGAAVGGFAGADAKCQAVSGCSTTTARMCNGQDVEASIRAGVFTGMANNVDYWYGGGDENMIYHMCKNWTAASGQSGDQISIDTSNNEITTGHGSCAIASAIVCCN